MFALQQNAVLLMFVIWQKWSSLFLDANEGLDYRQQSGYGMDKYVLQHEHIL